jgi:hypothetical protein
VGDVENRAEAEAALAAWLRSEFAGGDVDVRAERLMTSFALLGGRGPLGAREPTTLQVAKYLMDDEGAALADILRGAWLHDEPSIPLRDALARGQSVRVERNPSGLLVAVRTRASG